MKQTTFGAALAAAVLTVGLASTGVAVAQDRSPSCADAISDFNAAEKAWKKAVKADEDAAAAKTADVELDAAVRALAEARAVAALTDSLAVGDLSLSRIDAEINRLLEIDRTGDLTIDQVNELAADRKLRAAFQAEARARARAVATDAASLQVEADKTDAVVLKKELDEAKARVDRECGTTATPTPTPTPAPTTTTPAPAPPPVIIENDVDVRVPNSSRGVATGDGSLAA